MTGLDDALYLDDPGLRIRLIPEVRNQSALSIGLHHLDTDALVLLRDQSEDRFNHECCIGWRIAACHQPQRVPIPLLCRYGRQLVPRIIEARHSKYVMAGLDPAICSRARWPGQARP
jgi:hypothetical protein